MDFVMYDSLKEYEDAVRNRVKYRIRSVWGGRIESIFMVMV